MLNFSQNEILCFIFINSNPTHMVEHPNCNSENEPRDSPFPHIHPVEWQRRWDLTFNHSGTWPLLTDECIHSSIRLSGSLSPAALPPYSRSRHRSQSELPQRHTWPPSSRGLLLSNRLVQPSRSFMIWHLSATISLSSPLPQRAPWPISFEKDKPSPWLDTLGMDFLFFSIRSPGTSMCLAHGRCLFDKRMVSSAATALLLIPPIPGSICLHDLQVAFTT